MTAATAVREGIVAKITELNYDDMNFSAADVINLNILDATTAFNNARNGYA